MCLILLARDVRPDAPLVLAANRDEYFSRPTRPAHYWEDAPAVLGGRDLKAGGSWLGVDTAGRLAAVTNYREPPQPVARVESRGRLVSDYLTQSRQPAAYLEDVQRRRHRFDAFNLLVGRGTDLHVYSSRGAAPLPLAAGIHAVSNGDLDSPWPKMARGRRALGDILAAEAAPDCEALFALLADTTPAAAAELPDTGVDRDTEKRLSPMFVRMDGYGTRSSSALILHADGRIVFAERNYDEHGAVTGTGRFEFTVKYR